MVAGFFSEYFDGHQLTTRLGGKKNIDVHGGLQVSIKNGKYVRVLTCDMYPQCIYNIIIF